MVVQLVDKLADLHAWGRATSGQWWGLISWSVYGRLDDGINGHLFCSAWVLAGELQPSRDPSQQPLYRLVERFDLAAEPTTWPRLAAPAESRWHHYGAITARPPDRIPGMAYADPGGYPVSRGPLV